YTCERTVAAAADSPLIRYVETVAGLGGARCIMNDKGAEVPLPTQVHLNVGGSVRFRVTQGLCRTLSRSRALFGDGGTPFASVGLMNRYHSGLASLRVSGLDRSAASAFASATDLGTGLERPIGLEHAATGEVRTSYESCPPRTLLRIYWPLDRD
ncbi:MAG TPA: hypothetical protein VK524_24825, partial [Polyangiaceae bacterium]|nr:hypothetical protein [Polyangiaceae bacterium]